jgi:hypothetical protein
MDEEIHRKEIEVHGSIERGFHFGTYDALLERLKAFREEVLLVAAAAVYIQDGSINTVASVLSRRDFIPPRWYEAEDQEFVYEGMDALPMWVEENKGRIVAVANTSPLAKKLAGVDQEP